MLVVEDNQQLRHLLLVQLRTLGYAPIAAEAGGPALEILRSATKVDLLLTDVVMPGDIDGRRLAAEAIELRPNIKVILTSGYPLSTSLKNGEQPVLRKPYRKAILERTLREALARK